MLAAYATSLTMLYLTYGCIGGLGTGIVYVGVVGQMVGWFPDRRGFAAGMVAAGYGMGAIVTTFPISASLAARRLSGRRCCNTASIFGAVGFSRRRACGRRRRRATRDATRRTGASTGEMLKTPIFWLMFVMMTMMSTSGLMVTSQMATFAARFRRHQADRLGHGGTAAGADRSTASPTA